MEGYEFTEDENEIISSINLRVTLIGLVNIISAIVTWFIFAQSLNFALLVNGIVIIVIALAFIIPMQDLMKVVNTEGSDIEELMNGFKKINIGWLIYIIGLLYLRIFDYYLLS